MTLNLTKFLMLVLIMRISAENLGNETLSVADKEITSNFAEKTTSESARQSTENNTFIDFNSKILNDNDTSQMSQERILSPTKRAALSLPPRIPPFPHHHHIHPSYYLRLLNRHPRSFFGSKLRRPTPHKRSRKKPPSGPPLSTITKMLPQFTKLSQKRPLGKPIFLSEIMRAMSAHQYGSPKMKPPHHLFTKDYIEEDEIDALPFSVADSIAADTVDESYLPPVYGGGGGGSGKFFGQPSGVIDLPDDLHESLPPPVEEEIIIPDSPGTRPFGPAITASRHQPIISMLPPPQLPAAVSWPQAIKPSSSSSISSSSSSGAIYTGDDFYDSSVRNVRLAKPPTNDYVDKDIINLLSKLKDEGLGLDAKPPSAEAHHHYHRPRHHKPSGTDNRTEINAAISKLLSPHVSESAVRQIQSYFSRSPSDHQRAQPEKNVTKVVYIIENRDKENDGWAAAPAPGAAADDDGQYNSYSISEPLYEHATNNTTYFIMIKSPQRTNTTTSDIRTRHQHQQQQLQQQLRKKHTRPEQGAKLADVRTTLPPTPDSIALQNYIMSLAGINYSPADYLPHFNSFQKYLHNSVVK